MIACFPTPHPDELWYSVCARYGDHSHFPTETGVMQALYGTRHAVATVDLPHCLGALVSELPLGHPCTVGTIIDHHTALPYYGPFLKTGTYAKVRQIMDDGSDSCLRVRCGICTNRVRPPKFFRSCPACDRENREKYGEAYWRRLYQLPGVELCSSHKIYLQSSDIRLDPLPNRHRYFSAQSARLISAMHPIDLADPVHQILLDVTQEMEWLLDQTRLNPGLDALHERYREVLRLRGFETRGGTVRMNDLRCEVVRRYGHNALEVLQSDLPDGDGDGWLGNLLRKKDTATAPVRHVILLKALDIKLEEFFFPQRFSHAADAARKQVGPWPCLNPACECFRKPVIHHHTVEFLRKRKRDVGLFACDHCGYTYALYDWSKDPRNADFVRAYGGVWLGRLKELWGNLTVSVRETGARLGVDSKTVKQHALDAGLPLPREGKRRATASDLYRRRGVTTRVSVATQRAAWAELRRKNPTAGTNQLRALEPALYAWLYRNDTPWFKENQPARKKPTVTTTHVDWMRRDEQFAGQIATIAAHIRNRPGKPQRITTTAIGRALGKQSLFASTLTKLPLTRSVITTVTESGVDFAVRRVHLAAATLRQTERAFPRWKLVRAAGLHHQLQRVPRVKLALDYEMRPPVNTIILRSGDSVPPGLIHSSRRIPSRLRPLAIVQPGF
jgi:hypothetical protein